MTVDRDLGALYPHTFQSSNMCTAVEQTEDTLAAKKTLITLFIDVTHISVASFFLSY